MPNGRLDARASGRVADLFARETFDLRVDLVSQAPPKDREWIYRVGFGPGRLTVNQRRTAVILEVPRRLARLEVNSPTLRLDGGAPDDAGVPFSIIAGEHGERVWLETTVNGRTRRAEIVLAPTMAWGLVVPFGYALGPEAKWITMLWVAALMVPARALGIVHRKAREDAPHSRGRHHGWTRRYPLDFAFRARPDAGLGGRCARGACRVGRPGSRGLSCNAMRLSFRQRILLILIGLGAVPTAVAVLGWAYTIQSTSPAAGARGSMVAVESSGRTLLQTIDSTRLSSRERQALANHADKLNAALAQFQRAETFGRYYYAGLGLVVFLAGAAFLYASVRLGGHLSRQLSRPIEELIGWTGNIQRNEALPPDRPRRGAPEFEALRTALREMADSLERARAQEIEGERLRAFRETARRVAHEMRNPLTPIRLAVAQLSRSPTPTQSEAIEVLVAETGAPGAARTRVHRVRSASRGSGRPGGYSRATRRARAHHTSADHDLAVDARPRDPDGSRPLRSAASRVQQHPSQRRRSV